MYLIAVRCPFLHNTLRGAKIALVVENSFGGSQAFLSFNLELISVRDILLLFPVSLNPKATEVLPESPVGR